MRRNRNGGKWGTWSWSQSMVLQLQGNNLSRHLHLLLLPSSPTSVGKNGLWLGLSWGTASSSHHNKGCFIFTYRNEIKWRENLNPPKPSKPRSLRRLHTDLKEKWLENQALLTWENANCLQAHKCPHINLQLMGSMWTEVGNFCGQRLFYSFLFKAHLHIIKYFLPTREVSANMYCIFGKRNESKKIISKCQGLTYRKTFKTTRKKF